MTREIKRIDETDPKHPRNLEENLSRRVIALIKALRESHPKEFEKVAKEIPSAGVDLC